MNKKHSHKVYNFSVTKYKFEIRTMCCKHREGRLSIRTRGVGNISGKEVEGYGCVHGTFISATGWSLGVGWCQVELERLAN